MRLGGRKIAVQGLTVGRIMTGRNNANRTRAESVQSHGSNAYVAAMQFLAGT